MRRLAFTLGHAALAAYMLALVTGIAAQPAITALECLAFAGGLLVAFQCARRSLQAWRALR